ncbi:MAG: hypothetical protein FJ314_02215 [SAR202 cluster bacterium]|nr:hypothetical protein [SAR202 cluster bacterium]
MSRLGDYDVPDITLSESIALLRRVHGSLGTNASRAGVAGLLRLNPRGGWYASVLFALKIWGLIDGRGFIRLTPLGVRLATAQDAVARQQAAFSWPLLAALAGRIPGALPGRSDLALVLFEVTNAGAGRIHVSLVQVRRILEDAWPERASSAQPAAGPPAAADGTELAAQVPPGFVADEALQRIDLAFSGGQISLPETPENLELIIQLINRRLGQIRTEDPLRPSRGS